MFPIDQSAKLTGELVAVIGAVLAGDERWTADGYRYLPRYPQLLEMLERSRAALTAPLAAAQASASRTRQEAEGCARQHQQQSQALETREAGLARQLDDAQRELEACRTEQRVWEMTRMTLTEGCWDLVVVNGSLEDSATQIVASDQFMGLLGYSREEMPDIATGQAQITHGDDQERVMTLFERQIIDPAGAWRVRCQIPYVTQDRGLYLVPRTRTGDPRRRGPAATGNRCRARYQR